MLDKPIDDVKTVSDVMADPYNLPAGYVWSNVDISNRDEAHEVYELLT
jgi:hypothetical protein